MIKQLSIISLGILSIGSFSFFSLTNEKKSKVTFQENGNNKAAAHFKTYCSSCHGEKMEAFVDRKWKYGKSREDIFKSIKNGYEESGMPSFKTAFKDGEIYALADYILKGLSSMDRYVGS